MKPSTFLGSSLLGLALLSPTSLAGRSKECSRARAASDAPAHSKAEINTHFLLEAVNADMQHISNGLGAVLASGSSGSANASTCPRAKAAGQELNALAEGFARVYACGESMMQTHGNTTQSHAQSNSTEKSSTQEGAGAGSAGMHARGKTSSSMCKAGERYAKPYPPRKEASQKASVDAAEKKVLMSTMDKQLDNIATHMKSMPCSKAEHRNTTGEAKSADKEPTCADVNALGWQLNKFTINLAMEANCNATADGKVAKSKEECVARAKTRRPWRPEVGSKAKAPPKKGSNRSSSGKKTMASNGATAGDKTSASGAKSAKTSDGASAGNKTSASSKSSGSDKMKMSKSSSSGTGMSSGSSGNGTWSGTGMQTVNGKSNTVGHSQNRRDQPEMGGSGVGSSSSSSNNASQDDSDSDSEDDASAMMPQNTNNDGLVPSLEKRLLDSSTQRRSSADAPQDISSHEPESSASSPDDGSSGSAEMPENTNDDGLIPSLEHDVVGGGTQKRSSLEANVDGLVSSLEHDVVGGGNQKRADAGSPQDISSHQPESSATSAGGESSGGSKMSQNSNNGGGNNGGVVSSLEKTLLGSGSGSKRRASADAPGMGVKDEAQVQGQSQSQGQGQGKTKGTTASPAKTKGGKGQKHGPHRLEKEHKTEGGKKHHEHKHKHKHGDKHMHQTAPVKPKMGKKPHQAPGHAAGGANSTTPAGAGTPAGGSNSTAKAPAPAKGAPSTKPAAKPVPMSSTAKAPAA